MSCHHRSSADMDVVPLGAESLLVPDNVRRLDKPILRRLFKLSVRLVGFRLFKVGLAHFHDA